MGMEGSAMSAEGPRRCCGDSAATDSAIVQESNSDLIRHARQKLAQHSQLRRLKESFQIIILGDTLEVRGDVPSFYLKQMIQTVLRDLEGVRRIDNQVKVNRAAGAQ
jgi:hypothetical protein